MAHFNHRHITELKAPSKHPDGVLPGNQYGVLVGTLDHLSLYASDGTRKDLDHVYLWIHVNHGPQTGRYECAFSTESMKKSAALYYVREEEIHPSEIPAPGFWPAEASYSGLGLKKADFTPIANGELRSLIYHYAEESNIIAAYGITYDEGNGLHHIHMNSGDKAHRGKAAHANQDGVLIFYFRHETAASRRAWVFIKFADQSL